MLWRQFWLVLEHLVWLNAPTKRGIMNLLLWTLLGAEWLEDPQWTPTAHACKVSALLGPWKPWRRLDWGLDVEICDWKWEVLSSQ